MNIINSFTITFLRIKEKLGFKLSEKEDVLIIIDDANKAASMLLRMERVKEKMKMMSPTSSKAKIKSDKSDEDIRLYIR